MNEKNKTQKKIKNKSNKHINNHKLLTKKIKLLINQSNI
jgi:hypothetical protein